MSDELVLDEQVPWAGSLGPGMTVGTIVVPGLPAYGDLPDRCVKCGAGEKDAEDFGKVALFLGPTYWASDENMHWSCFRCGFNVFTLCRDAK